MLAERLCQKLVRHEIRRKTTEILGTPWLRRNKVIPSNVEQVKGAAQLDATVGHILAVLEDGLLHGGDSAN